VTHCQWAQKDSQSGKHTHCNISLSCVRDGNGRLRSEFVASECSDASQNGKQTGKKVATGCSSLPSSTWDSKCCFQKMGW
jgi:hypothetical protein